MAGVASLQGLLEEATCSICLEYFQDPVLIPECGHNFCWVCLTRSWGTSESEASCPQCRQTFALLSVLPNRQLARVAEEAKRCGGSWGEEGGSFCPKHRELLKLFCKDDETLICVDCMVCKEHKGHSVIPPEEAFPEYQIEVGHCLKAQKEQREKIATYEEDTEQTVQKVLDLIKEVKKDVVAKFRELQLWLKAQENLLLTKMEETEKDIMARKEKGLARHTEKLCSLDDLILEIEEKLQQPASKLLQPASRASVSPRSWPPLPRNIAGSGEGMLPATRRTSRSAPASFPAAPRARRRAGPGARDNDIGSILKKYQAKKTYENPVDLFLEPKWAIWDYSDDLSLLKSAKKKLRDTLESRCQLQEENVTLDPDTANLNHLQISRDRKTVTGVKPDKVLYIGQKDKIFQYNPYVLGCQRFSTGKHFWEVILRDGAEWGVGVAIKPENVTNVYVQTRHWQIGEWEGKYIARSPSECSDLVLTERPTRIRVSLNCERGKLDFFDARTAALLHTFSDASLVGETLWPCFFLHHDVCMTLPQVLRFFKSNKYDYSE
ncbi:E3 ubiquitin-protein ligase TRIM39-like isoform X1 [Erythrolamprus reginae]|uniref:E3 ubiquitin-protein ligase TRIM39-like isoform X1 n=1 Tax=Erythrolamprus reginae TaxID=121349 RepID=UPI00396CD192